MFRHSIREETTLPMLGIYLWELVLYETLMFAVVQFHHSDIDIPAKADRALRAVIVSPNIRSTTALDLFHQELSGKPATNTSGWIPIVSLTLQGI